MPNITDITDYVVIDVETTGFSSDFNSIIQFSAIKVSGGTIIDCLSSYIHTDCPIPDKITELTGITNDMLENAPVLSDLENDIRKFIGNSVIVGHNVSFDIRMLDNELSAPIYNETLDTVKLARERVELNSYKLELLCAALGVISDKFHDSFSDCKATYECFERLKLIQIIPTRDPEIINMYSNSGDIRAIRAESCNPLNIDHTEYKGTFLGNGGTVYETTLKSCSCPDFHERHKPCKHMYRLYNELRNANLKRKSIRKLHASDFKSDENCPFNLLKNKVIVITGTLSISREEAYEKLSSHGAVVSDSVTKKTDYLVLGYNQLTSSKEKRAREYAEKGIPIKIISEQELYNLMESKRKLYDLLEPIIRESEINSEFVKIRRSESISTPDDYSISFYGVLAMKLCERKKSDSYIRVSCDLASDFIPKSGLSYVVKGTDYLIYATESDVSELSILIRHLIDYCDDNAVCTFDVCSHYKECSASMKCVNPDQGLSLECSYRKKLKKGIRFY